MCSQLCPAAVHLSVPPSLGTMPQALCLVCMEWQQCRYCSTGCQAVHWGEGHNRECDGEAARRGFKRLGLLEDVILNIQCFATQRPGPNAELNTVSSDVLWGRSRVLCPVLGLAWAALARLGPALWLLLPREVCIW